MRKNRQMRYSTFKVRNFPLVGSFREPNLRNSFKPNTTDQIRALPDNPQRRRVICGLNEAASKLITAAFADRFRREELAAFQKKHAMRSKSSAENLVRAV